MRVLRKMHWASSQHRKTGNGTELVMGSIGPIRNFRLMGKSTGVIATAFASRPNCDRCVAKDNKTLLEQKLVWKRPEG